MTGAPTRRTGPRQAPLESRDAAQRTDRWDSTNRQRQRRPWSLTMSRIRRHEPDRPDRLIEAWTKWVAAHDGDEEAALGAILLVLLDELT